MRKLAVEWDYSVPSKLSETAEKRTNDMVLFYGRFITTISITQLARSCYLQGARDALEVAIAMETK